MWLIFRSVDWLYFAFKKNFLVHGLQRLTLIAIKLWKKLVLWILMSTSAIHALTGNFFRQFFNVTVYKTFCKLALIIFYGTPPKSTYSGHTEWLLWLKTQLRQNFCQKGRRTGPSAAQERWAGTLWFKNFKFGGLKRALNKSADVERTSSPLVTHHKIREKNKMANSDKSSLYEGF